MIIPQSVQEEANLTSSPVRHITMEESQVIKAVRADQGEPEAQPLTAHCTAQHEKHSTAQSSTATQMLSAFHYPHLFFPSSAQIESYRIDDTM